MLRRSGIPHLVALAAGLASAGLPSAASGQGADLTRVECRQFNALPIGERRQIGLWLHGYYTGVAQRPLLDLSQLGSRVGALVAACESSPDLPLLGEETGAILRGLASAASPAAPSSGTTITVEPPAGEVAADAPEASPAPVQRPRPID